MRPYLFSRVIVQPSRALDRPTRLGDDEVGPDETEQPVPGVEVVRRVGEHDVAVDRRRHRHGVGGQTPSSDPAARACRGSLERAQRGAVAFDEHATLGTSRQRFDADRAAAGEEIGDERPVEHTGTAERVEDRLADPIGRRTGARCPAGATSRRPPSSPATTRIAPGYAEHDSRPRWSPSAHWSDAGARPSDHLHRLRRAMPPADHAAARTASGSRATSSPTGARTASTVGTS